MIQFKTVYKEVSTETIEKKSRFIAHVKPITSEEQALDFINSLKSKYWDATHNVYAYVLSQNSIQRYSDDGEPQGTAGIPTLQAIKGLDLQDVVVVVTRYFGGTLLGTGGLVRAYGKSAKEGLLEAQIITKRICEKIELTIDYTLLGKIQSEILSLGYVIENIIYQENVIIEVLLPHEEIEKFNKALMDIICGDANINIVGEKIILLDSSNKLLEVAELEWYVE